MLITTGRPPEVDDLLARARTLSPDEIRAVAAADAALVALLPDGFTDDVAARVEGPWRRVACG